MSATPSNGDAPRASGANAKKAIHRPKPTASAKLKPPAHHNAPPGTSDEAARRIEPHRPTQRERVRALIESRGASGATDQEGAELLGMAPDSYRPSRIQLVQLRLVSDSGRRRTTRAGRPAAVWITTPNAGDTG